MSFRVMHHSGSREDLLAQARRSAEEMRQLADREDFNEDEWDRRDSSPASPPPSTSCPPPAGAACSS